MFFCFLSTMGAIIETKLLIYTQCVVANDDHGGTGVCKVCSHHPAPSPTHSGSHRSPEQHVRCHLPLAQASCPPPCSQIIATLKYFFLSSCFATLL